MPLQTLVSSFGLILLTEIGDKTMLTTLCLSAQYRRPWLVLLSSMLALTAASLIAVIVGYALSESLPIGMITLVSGFLFIILGIYTLLRPEPEEDACERPSNLLGMFTLMLFSELGDKSQIMILALATQSPFPAMILVGAISGFLVVNTIGAAAGNHTAAKIPMDKVRLITGLVFITFGILILMGII